jgi:cytochrome P450
VAVDLSVPSVREDPYPLYRWLRENEPLSRVENFMGKPYIVNRYEDVVTVLRDPRFANDRRKVDSRAGNLIDAWWLPRVFRALADSMLMADEPDHRRLRGLVHQAFTPQMVESMTPRIENVSRDLLDAIARKPAADLIAEFALPLPLTVISEMMGVPHNDRLKFHKWSSTFIDSTSGKPWHLLVNLPNTFLMDRFFKQLIELRRREPSDDIITGLVQAEEGGDVLSEDELSAMLFLLLLAGHETTVNLIGNGTLALLEHPDQLQRLRENPDLMGSAIEELLRFTNPVQHIAPRYALEDIELCGQVIPRGSSVLVNLASANRDESVFQDADRMDIARQPNKHVAFGTGIHYCLGAPLARMEARIAFSMLLERFPNLRLAVPAQEIQWRSSVSLRGLKSLPVRLD